jgi:Flp pilus assembly protein TadG
MRRVRDDRGTAIVEAPICICIVLLLAMGVLTLTQVVWTHMDLSTTVRDAARYASRAEWDPSASQITLDRYRTVGDVREFATGAGSETGVAYQNVVVNVFRDGAEVTPAPSDDFVLQLDDRVTVELVNRVSNPLYQTAASVTNLTAGIFHLGRPFDEDGVDIKAKATSYVE